MQMNLWIVISGLLVGSLAIVLFGLLFVVPLLEQLIRWRRSAGLEKKTSKY